MDIFLGFTQNAALLLLLTLIFDVRMRGMALPPERAPRLAVAVGVLLGGAGIVTMLAPLRLEQGIMLDARGLLLAIGGLYFGTVPTVIAMVLTALFRLFALGGPAAPFGVAFILGSGLLGLGCRRLCGRHGQEPSLLGVAGLGATVGVLQVGVTCLILRDQAGHVALAIAPVIVPVSALATLLMGHLLSSRARHAAMVEELRSASLRNALQVAALNAAVDAVMITDTDGRVIWANPAFSSLTQYTLDEAKGKNPRELLRSGKQPDAFYGEMWRTLLDGRVWSGELTNRRKDGSEYLEEQTITPVKGEDGRVTHFIAIKRDVTHRRLLEQQLNQSQRIEGLGRLAGGVAHDFNNLLTVISGTLELALLRARGDAAMTLELQTARDAAARGAKLTRQLLAFSRQQVLQPTVVDLNVIVTEMHELLSRVLGERISIQLELEARLASIRADAGQLGQVLMNLVVNARDAMPDGGTIGIHTTTITLANAGSFGIAAMPAGRFVTLSVSDTGTGMDAATRERIFDPFFTTKAPGKGTGLGLPTAYGIVKQSGGFLWLDTAPGRGTTFHLAFPAVDEAPAERISGPTPKLELDDAPSAATATILVVEDEDAIRHVAERVLSSRGYNVITAASGEEAVAIAAGKRIDLLLTDMMMPGMSGPQLAERLRESQPEVKVLFTSGYSHEAVATGIGDAGFIAKPYGLRELVLAVRARLSV